MTRQEAIAVLKMVEAHGLADKAKQMAIDALAQPEIVRCKDCSRWCICHHSDNWYCADGERRETE